MVQLLSYPLLLVVDEFDADKTRILRRHGFARRNLGTEQMTMDTAAICAKLILADGVSFDRLAFIDRPNIRLNKNEYVQMNFRYLSGHENRTEPLISDAVIRIIRENQDFALGDLE